MSKPKVRRGWGPAHGHDLSIESCDGVCVTVNRRLRLDGPGYVWVIQGICVTPEHAQVAAESMLRAAGYEFEEEQKHD